MLAGVLGLGFHFISLMVHVVRTEVVILDGPIGQAPIVSALSWTDVCPALMGACQSGDLLPNNNAFNREEGALTLRHMTNHLINLAGPRGWSHKIGSNSLIVADNIGQGDLGVLSKTSVEPLIHCFKGTSPVLVVDPQGFNIHMTCLPILVGLHSPDCI